ncbi:multidrug DMT transporter permease [Caballeronia novacaledonica]|uniref:Multidrug DMT transporter permease n=1 Tax=Caballeronia novacaledonica TaxID=1544861 RepID=A0A2U3I6C9_9BURK|nr:DMT family transporter [Caballeronia novacaledonica]SPB15657.1 multidrug DMT transporter permease [Caballeronia novacaledonica]
MVVAWSSGFVGMRFSTDYAPVFLVVLWRCAALSVCLLPLVAREIVHTPRTVLLRQAAIGLFALAGYIAGVAKGIELGVSAGLCALIANLLPIGTVAISSIFLRERIPRRTWAGMALGLAGVLMVSRDALTLGSAPVWAYALPVAGMMSLAVATVWQQRAASRIGSLSLLSTLWVHCVVSCAVFAGLQMSQGSVMPIATAGFAASVGWTAVISTIGGYGLYWVCLRRSSPARVSSVLFLSPSVTFVWAWALFGEPLSWPMLAGTIVSGLGIVVMTTSIRRRLALADKG